MSAYDPYRRKVLIIQSRFYPDISDEIFKGAKLVLERKNVNFNSISVPGSLEIPSALSFSIHTRYGGYIVLGCVIRGKTSHYNLVCQESIRGVMNLACKHKLALGFGIITAENKKQALERASVKKCNKGGQAAETCLQMIKIKKP